MFDRRRLPLVLATVAVVLGATLAIAGNASKRLQRHVTAPGSVVFATPTYVAGLQTHRFEVTVQTLRAWLSGPTPPVLVDVRDASVYEAGHLPNSLNRPAADLLSGKVGFDASCRGSQVVIYDQDGRLTPMLLHPLRAGGIDAYLLAGGYAAWMSPHAPRPGEPHEQDAAPEATGARPAASSSAASSASAPLEADVAPSASPAEAAPPPPPPPGVGPLVKKAPAPAEGC
jgi:rhodanese-related sulfurtransferase